MRKRSQCAIALLVCVFLLLSACGSPETQAAETAVSSAKAGTYVVPAMKTAVFHPSAAETEAGVSADFSALADGYVAIQASSASRLKFQVICGDGKYNYDLPNDGSAVIFPLNMGDGEYQFRVMQNVSGDKYSELWSRKEAVSLQSEFEPFLRPSQMVQYSEASASVAKARELATSCGSDAQVAAAVYDYLVSAISYDYDKAENVQSGYLPVPDETLSSRTGICFDYAALAAAMLRSVGIPCKLITGYVDPEEIYHAWNVFYLQSQGWITVEIKAGPASWKRVDITFAASGVPASKTNDDTLYTTRFVY